jgi:hypothetical protein
MAFHRGIEAACNFRLSKLRLTTASRWRDSSVAIHGPTILVSTSASSTNPAQRCTGSMFTRWQIAERRYCRRAAELEEIMRGGKSALRSVLMRFHCRSHRSGGRTLSPRRQKWSLGESAPVTCYWSAWLSLPAARLTLQRQGQPPVRRSETASARFEYPQLLHHGRHLRSSRSSAAQARCSFCS